MPKIMQPKLLKIIAVVILVTGLALLPYMIVVEDEPGALPLALIAIGILGLFMLKLKK